MQLERQFEQFRSTRSGREKLPDSLWQAAVEQARQRGGAHAALPPTGRHTGAARTRHASPAASNNCACQASSRRAGSPSASGHQPNRPCDSHGNTGIYCPRREVVKPVLSGAGLGC
jgi:hypothetical protein